jgi:hypothetical protein
MPDDTQTTLAPDDVRGINALIKELDRRVREPGNYTSQEATAFVRRWMAARESRT